MGLDLDINLMMDMNRRKQIVQAVNIHQVL